MDPRTIAISDEDVFLKQENVMKAFEILSDSTRKKNFFKYYASKIRCYMRTARAKIYWRFMEFSEKQGFLNPEKAFDLFNQNGNNNAKKFLGVYLDVTSFINSYYRGSANRFRQIGSWQTKVTKLKTTFEALSSPILAKQAGTLSFPSRLSEDTAESKKIENKLQPLMYLPGLAKMKSSNSNRSVLPEQMNAASSEEMQTSLTVAVKRKSTVLTSSPLPEDTTKMSKLHKNKSEQKGSNFFGTPNRNELSILAFAAAEEAGKGEARADEPAIAHCCSVNRYKY